MSAGLVLGAASVAAAAFACLLIGAASAVGVVPSSPPVGLAQVVATLAALMAALKLTIAAGAFVAYWARG